MLAEPELASKGHPRILFNSEKLEAIRALSETHEENREMYGLIRVDADEITCADWWNNFPETDRISPNEAEQIYSEITSDMIIVTFAYPLAEEKKRRRIQREIPNGGILGGRRVVLPGRYLGDREGGFP